MSSKEEIKDIEEIVEVKVKKPRAKKIVKEKEELETKPKAIAKPKKVGEEVKVASKRPIKGSEEAKQRMALVRAGIKKKENKD